MERVFVRNCSLEVMVITRRLRKLLTLIPTGGVTIKGHSFVRLEFLNIKYLIILILRDIRYTIREMYLQSYHFGIIMLVLSGHLG